MGRHADRPDIVVRVFSSEDSPSEENAEKPPRQTTRRTRKAKPAGATATSVATAAHSATDRHDYFASIQGLLVNCHSYASMKLTIPDTFLYPFEPTPPSETTLQGMPEDAIAAQLLSQVTGIDKEQRSPHGDARENCERAAAAR